MVAGATIAELRERIYAGQTTVAERTLQRRQVAKGDTEWAHRPIDSRHDTMMRNPVMYMARPPVHMHGVRAERSDPTTTAMLLQVVQAQLKSEKGNVKTKKKDT